MQYFLGPDIFSLLTHPCSTALNVFSVIVITFFFVLKQIRTSSFDSISEALYNPALEIIGLVIPNRLNKHWWQRTRSCGSIQYIIEGLMYMKYLLHVCSANVKIT